MKDIVTIYLDTKTADMVITWLNHQLEKYKTSEAAIIEVLAQLEQENGTYII